jgi:hypothetical protein
MCAPQSNGPEAPLSFADKNTTENYVVIRSNLDLSVLLESLPSQAASVRNLAR